MRALLRGKLSHAYIISGGDEKTRDTASDFLAAAALCSAPKDRPCGVCSGCRKSNLRIHPDLHRYERPASNRQLPVDTIRALRAEAYILPNEASMSVFIVKDAHTMNSSAQNALLKVFEEPPGHVVIALLTENAGELLPTLRSRAVTLRLDGDASHATADAAEQARSIAALMASGSIPEAAAQCLRLDKLDREMLSGVLAGLRYEAVEGLRCGTGLPPARAGALLRLLAELMRYMDFNVGAGHIAGALAAFAASETMEMRKGF